MTEFPLQALNWLIIWLLMIVKITPAEVTTYNSFLSTIIDQYGGVGMFPINVRFKSKYEFLMDLNLLLHIWIFVRIFEVF